MQKTTLKQEFN